MRYERGRAMWRQGMVAHNGQPGQYYVKSAGEQGKRYLVATPWAACGMRCDCPDHKERGMICKHMIAAACAEAAERIGNYLMCGGTIRELKNQAIAAGLTGIPDDSKGLIWRASYDLLQEMEEDR